MLVIVFSLALFTATASLVAYARRDRFAGPAFIADRQDELGSLLLRDRVSSAGRRPARLMN